jgi:hypothetical protein
MHKNAMKCNKTQSIWCINKHGASKIIDTFEMYHWSLGAPAPDGLDRAHMDSSGLGSSAAGHPGGGGDDLEGFGTVARRPANCSRVAGALQAHLGSAG